MSYLKSCFKRLFCSPAFYAAILGTAVICLFSSVFDIKAGTMKSIIYMYTNYTKDELLAYKDMCSYSVFKNGLGSWLSMFSPVFAVFACVGIKSDEKSIGADLFFIHRVGKTRYNIGSCLFYLLSGGLTVFLGYGLFTGAVYLAFPHISEYSAESAELIISFEQNSIMETLYRLGGEGITVAAYLLEIFFYGMVCSAVPMAISVFTANKYLIICTPFFIKYAVDCLSGLFYSWAGSDPDNYKEVLAEIGGIIDPESVVTIFSNNYSMIPILLLNTAVIAAMSIFYCIYNQRKQNV